MTTKKMLIVGFLLAGTTIVTSCKKEGCMDADSTTYDSEARKDDGTCKYEGEVLFWFNQATSQALIADGATALKYYVDGALVGSAATSVYYSTSPGCGASGVVTVVKDLGSSKTKSFTFSVKDDTGFEYYQGSKSFTANTCLALELN